VQDKGSKILGGRLGDMKATPSALLHQEYLTINLGVGSAIFRIQVAEGCAIAKD